MSDECQSAAVQHCWDFPWSQSSLLVRVSAPKHVYRIISVFQQITVLWCIMYYNYNVLEWIVSLDILCTTSPMCIPIFVNIHFLVQQRIPMSLCSTLCECANETNNLWLGELHVVGGSWPGSWRGNNPLGRGIDVMLELNLLQLMQHHLEGKQFPNLLWKRHVAWLPLQKLVSADIETDTLLCLTIVHQKGPQTPSCYDASLAPQTKRLDQTPYQYMYDWKYLHVYREHFSSSPLMYIEYTTFWKIIVKRDNSLSVEDFVHIESWRMRIASTTLI